MKYYYTDPLAAAWMAMKFGMRFEPLFNASRPFEWETAEPYVSRNMTWGAGFTYYIHPESLHLLEPKDGDCGIANEGHMVRRWGILWIQPDGYHPPTKSVQIIQRNSITFMWPEVKE